MPDYPSYDEIIAAGCPIVVSREANEPRWPIKSLVVGASCSAPEEDEKPFRAAAAHVNKRGKIKVTVRKVDGVLWCIRLF